MQACGGKTTEKGGFYPAGLMRISRIELIRHPHSIYQTTKTTINNNNNLTCCLSIKMLFNIVLCCFCCLKEGEEVKNVLIGVIRRLKGANLQKSVIFAGWKQTYNFKL
jgi:hypothetical protein